MRRFLFTILWQHHSDHLIGACGAAGIGYICRVCLCQNGLLWKQSTFCDFSGTDDDCTGSIDSAKLQPNGKLGLNDSRIGIALPFFASAMGTLIVRQTIKTIPYELEEAAQVEGASFMQIITKVYVPLLKPAFVAFGMISVSYQWNNFLWPLVMTDSVSKRPLSLGLAMFAMSFETGAQWSDVSAATFLVCAPLLILFVVFQKQFIESFVHSGIK